ncbi:MAG: glycosyltransferase [Chloroflexi bacterium]|nr:glycosyltransferase [Chloroflexota bacterium]
MSLDLGVIIVSYNTRELTADCLTSVYNSLCASALAAQVWVVDNASEDGSAEMVAQRFPQATLIRSERNLGFSGGNNLALRAMLAGSDPPRHVLLLNSDTLVHAGALEAMVAWLNDHPAVGIVGAALRYADGGFQHSAFRFPTLPMIFFDFWPLNHRLLNSRLNGRYPRKLYEAGRPFPIDHPLGAALMIRWATLEQIGLLDEGYFMYCEEIDWCMRAKKAGWEVWCVPRAVITHLEGRSAARFRERMYVELWRSRYRLFAKHYGPLYRSLARLLVRAGMVWQVGKVRRALERNEIDRQEAGRRLAAYRRVLELEMAGALSASYGPSSEPAREDLPDLAVGVLAGNSAEDIAACLESASWAQERIVVLDTRSNDGTAEIARAMGARVVPHPFQDFGRQREFGLSLPRSEWLFYLDTDERITPELAEELRRVITQHDIVGWWVPRRNIIWGREIRHGGWSPDYQLRLLKRGHAHYDPSRPVHETVLLDGPEGFLQQPLLHYNYRTIGQFVAKQRQYVGFEAEILYRRGVRPKPWTWLSQPLREFWRRYIRLRGYRDGIHGLLLCGLVAYYYGFVVTRRLSRRWRQG